MFLIRWRAFRNTSAAIPIVIDIEFQSSKLCLEIVDVEYEQLR